MRVRLMKRAACLLLVVYAVALAHQLLPHRPALHGADGDRCALCVLLAGVALVVASLAVFALGTAPCPEARSLAAPTRHRIWSPCLRRGPPTHSS